MCDCTVVCVLQAALTVVSVPDDFIATLATATMRCLGRGAQWGSPECAHIIALCNTLLTRDIASSKLVAVGIALRFAANRADGRSEHVRAALKVSEGVYGWRCATRENR